MRNIYFSQKVYERVDSYIYNYRQYFFDLYSDTGIWSEANILNYYSDAALLRRQEILELIKNRLQDEPVLWNSGQQTVKILWKKRILLVSWEDEDNESRMISDLEIL